MKAQLRDEKWFYNEAYPFQYNYFKTDAGEMHYVDEGQGEPILFIHGTPAWSFLYREQIKALSKSYRCIAPDHIGFGLSDKPKDFDGMPKAHSERLEALVDHLGLDNITLVVHDFGGPIGLGFALRNPDKIKRVVILNTWLWETTSNPEVEKVDKVLNSWLGRFMYLNLNFSPKVLLKQAFYDKSKLTKAIYKHYVNVFPNKDTRYGLLKIGQALKGSSDWYQQQWEQLDRLEDKPTLILWGMKDAFIKPEFLEKWQKRLPDARVVKYDCGHFLQEEKAGGVAKEIQAFVG